MESWILFTAFAVIAFSVYFAPSSVANKRHAKHFGSIFVVNLFLGWTLIGWVLALAWAMGDSVKARA